MCEFRAQSNDRFQLTCAPPRLYFPRNSTGRRTMQTLNVGAGQTDQEYKAAEEQRRADLRSSSRSDADYFFFAAALSALGTGILTVEANFLVSIGTFDLRKLYGRPLGSLYLVAVYGLAALWPLVMVGLGIRRPQRPALGLPRRNRYLRRRHDPSHRYIFNVGIRTPRLLPLQMVPGTKSAERYERSGRLDSLNPRNDCGFSPRRPRHAESFPQPHPYLFFSCDI